MIPANVKIGPFLKMVVWYLLYEVVLVCMIFGHVFTVYFTSPVTFL